MTESRIVDPIAAAMRLFRRLPEGAVHHYVGDLVIPEGAGESLFAEVPFGEGEGIVFDEPLSGRFPLVLTFTPSEDCLDRQGMLVEAATVLFREVPPNGVRAVGGTAGLLPGVGMMWLGRYEPLFGGSTDPLLIAAIPELRRRGLARADQAGWQQAEFVKLLESVEASDSNGAYAEGWHELVLDEDSGANAFGFLTGERSAGWGTFADSEGLMVAAVLGLDD
ncbi:hypothetical protein [Kitasatospora sp. NBC_01266]|uniref:hypothetical protein n=1 Tax=Kitasatospora sp. NBC_01266 TaxID=2903572 RepID=UPI002E31D511|nr:hypothetical protein [Kitasatospora sp. NBC_01266]